MNLDNLQIEKSFSESQLTYFKDEIRKLRESEKSFDDKTNNLRTQKTEALRKQSQVITQKQNVDQTRIKSILSSIRKKSIQNNIDPKITSKIWKSIIWSYVEFQRRNFKKKELFAMRGKFLFYEKLMLPCSWIILFNF